MNDYGTVIAPGTIRFQRLLPGPIERIWEYITDSAKRGTWLATGPMELRPGASFALHFRHADLTPHDEEVPERFAAMKEGMSLPATVIACEPPRLLVHSWGGGTDASEVTYELSAQGDRVLLVLTHRRLEGEGMLQVAGGWHTHLDILEARITDRTPPPFWKTHARLERDYAERLAAGTGQVTAAAATKRRQTA
jgi:uncharacterized protein YndB with AHSA1/START domain